MTCITLFVTHKIVKCGVIGVKKGPAKCQFFTLEIKT